MRGQFFPRALLCLLAISSVRSLTPAKVRDISIARLERGKWSEPTPVKIDQ
jgi:hypothetical protein